MMNVAEKTKHSDEIDFLYPGGWKQALNETEEYFFKVMADEVMLPFLSPSRSLNDFMIANNNDIGHYDEKLTTIYKERPFYNDKTKTTSLEKKERQDTGGNIIFASKTAPAQFPVKFDIPSFFIRDWTITEWINDDRSVKTSRESLLAVQREYLEDHDRIDARSLQDIHDTDTYPMTYSFNWKDVESRVDDLLNAEKECLARLNNPKPNREKNIEAANKLSETRKKMLDLVNKTEPTPGGSYRWPPTPGLKGLLKMKHSSFMLGSEQEIISKALFKSIIGITRAATTQERPFDFIAKEFKEIDFIEQKARNERDPGDAMERNKDINYLFKNLGIGSSMGNGMAFQSFLRDISSKNVGYNMDYFLTGKDGHSSVCGEEVPRFFDTAWHSS